MDQISREDALKFQNLLISLHSNIHTIDFIFPLQLQIMGDDLSISNYSPSPRRQIRRVRKIVPHPLYDDYSKNNDIAVIFVCIREIISFAFTEGFFHNVIFE